MKKQGSRPSTGNEKPSLKLPTSFTASRQKLTVPQQNNDQKSTTKPLTASRPSLHINSSTTSKPSLQNVKPIADSRLSIQSPKNQFINVQCNSISQTQTHHKSNSFNFNFNKSGGNNNNNERGKVVQQQQVQDKMIVTGSNNNNTASQVSLNESGYKSFIQIANKKEQNSRTTNTSPIVNKQIGQQQNVKNESLNFSCQVQQQQQQIIIPSQSAKASPLRNVSPGEKIVIKKSEIKFSPPREQSPQLISSINIETRKDVIMQQNKGGESPKPSDLISHGKQLAFDFIKSMLNIGPQKNEQKDENYSSSGVLKKKFMKFGSPGPNHKTLKKQSINFVHDMKKHGISKDIESVKAMRYFIENSPNQSENTSIIDQSQQNAPSDLLFMNSSNNMDNAHGNLQIETTFKGANALLEVQKVSPSNENNYIFPFQRRARSHSPPKDNSIGQVNSQHSQGSIHAESPPGGISILHFKMPGNDNKNLQNKQQTHHQRTNSGPIIPDRNCIEHVIRSTPGIFFGMGPHLGNHQQKNDEIDVKILKGQEVDEWLNHEDQPLTKQKSVQKHENDNIKSPFQQLGFIGDADDVDDEEIKQNDSDEWMFQTFENKNNMPQKPMVQKMNQGFEQIDEIDDQMLLDDEFDDSFIPSANQLGTDTGGAAYTNMLDQWLTKMK